LDKLEAGIPDEGAEVVDAILFHSSGVHRLTPEEYREYARRRGGTECKDYVIIRTFPCEEDDLLLEPMLTPWPWGVNAEG